MSILKVPSQYPTIQLAVDAATSGDEIIISEGIYKENVNILKDKLTLISPSVNTILSGDSLGGIGINIIANNTTLVGLAVVNYETGVAIIGNNNVLNFIKTINNTLGITSDGNYNSFISCSLEFNSFVALNIIGNYNQVVATRLADNTIAISATYGAFSNNVFYKNNITNTKEYAIRVSSPRAENNVFMENTISVATYGILCNFGTVAIISNSITQTEFYGIIYKGNNGIILENTLVNCNIGMNLITCNSVINGNTSQNQTETGILLVGGCNEIIGNIVTSCNDVGLLINGCNNTLCNNILIKNKINEIISGSNNITDCKKIYCSTLGCTKFNNYLDILSIFNTQSKCSCYASK